MSTVEKEAELRKKEEDLQRWRMELETFNQRVLAEKARVEEENRKLVAAAQGLQMLAGTEPEGAHAFPRNAQGQAYTTVVKGTIGNISEFSMDDDWTYWCERLEMYIATNEVENNRKVSLLLTLLGKDGYTLLRSLTTPRVPSEMTFEEIKTVMKNHLQPAPSVITERYKFKECRQREGEDVKSFLANLKKHSTFCEFGQNLDSNIRDQFVWGLSSEAVKKRLLGERELTYHRAVELALSLESAGRDAAEMSTATGSGNINFVAPKERTSSSKGNANARNCYCCGKANHIASNCRFKEYKCNLCGKKGHLKNMCKNKSESGKYESKFKKSNKESSNYKRERQNFVTEVDEITEQIDRLFHLDTHESNDALTGKRNSEPIVVDLNVEGHWTKFEIDTGSPISAISTSYFYNSKTLSELTVKNTSRRFKSYNGHIIVPKGILNVKVSFNGNNYKLELFVIPGDSTPIIGRQWLRILGILNKFNDFHGQIQTVKSITATRTVNSIVADFKEVFSDKLGRYNRTKFSLELKRDAKPVFCKPRPVPYALREKIEAELDRLVKAEVLEPVNTSEWATPIVPVLKSNGQIRICGDFKITLNPHLIVNKHPIPRVIDLATKMAKAVKITKLDLAHAYQQVELDEASKKLVVITTHKGLFKCNRLMYGVSPAPGRFQEEMEKILSGINGAIVYFDDIFIFGKTQEEHDNNLRVVLSRFKEYGLTVKLSKCQFDQSRVQFLGYEIDREGLHISKSKTDAVVNLKRPENVSELKTILGFLNYYSRFIKNYAQIVNPLYDLLKKDIPWRWTPERETAFQNAKSKLESHEVLVHYETDVPIKITCDASPKGLGSVLSHVYPNGDERPIAFASRALTKAERNYSQLDKEALALVYGVKYFHQFVYGRNFLLETDHKPLTFIFGPKKGLPQMAASRVQRWAVFLSAYDFTIKHVKGSDNGPADSLSRNLVTDFKSSNIGKEADEYSYLNCITEAIKNVDCAVIREETSKDPILSQIVEYMYSGWPIKVHDSLQQFKVRQNELTLEQGCLMWGHRVIIPNCLRANLLEELHSAHMGVIKMKSLARSYFWWPGLDQSIEKMTKSCELCLENAKNPPKATLHVWKWPEGPNKRLHADFCGPINGYMYLIITDAYSKWIDVKEMTDITAPSTIRMLKEYFSVWGLPEILVTDNGPTFTSESFQVFLKENFVKHQRTAPYHPASNGAAENAVRTFKDKFKLLVKSKMSRHDALYKYLFSYRTTPHCTTGCTPAELQVGRKLRTRLSVIQPTVREKVELSQARQQYYFRGNRKTEFSKNDPVMAREYSKNANRWQRAQIVEQLTPVTYSVRTENNKILKRHVDQINPRGEKPSNVSKSNVNVSDTNNVTDQSMKILNAPTFIVKEPQAYEQNNTNTDDPVNVTRDESFDDKIIEHYPPVAESQPERKCENQPAQLRRSTRMRKAPNRLNL